MITIALRVVHLLVLALAGTWLALWWTPSVFVGIVGALGLLGWFVPVLVLQFRAAARANRQSGAPAAERGHWLRAWWAEVLTMVQVFVWRQAVASDAVPDHLHDAFGSRGRRGVVLIHGLLCNRGLWNHWMRHLLRDRRAFIAVNLEPVFGSIDAYVAVVEDAVARVEAATGQPPLIIGHSMGGLAARAWMRADVRNVQRVCHVVTLGTPHQGTAARGMDGGWALNGVQMQCGSAWLTALAADEQQQDAQLTGQDSRYARLTCFWSNCDNIVFPAETATLPGADNRFEPGLAHLELAFDPRIQAEVFQQFLLPNQ